jgi:hypothetical protein
MQRRSSSRVSIILFIRQMISKKIYVKRCLPWVILSITALTLTVGVVGEASAHRCRFKLAEERNLCLAQKEEKRYFCRFIKNEDQQHYCFAWVDRNPKACAKIKDEAFKGQCTADAQSRLDESNAAKALKETERKAAEAQSATKEPAQKK